MSSEFNNVPKTDGTPSVRINVVEQVFIANARALPARRVPLTAALVVADRVLARTQHTDPTARAFAVERAVDRFLELATKGARADQLQLENLDLLPAAHPLSTAPLTITASALVDARAEWLAADPRIAEEIRPLVAAAYTMEFGTLEREHALARLDATPVSMLPREITALVAVGGNSSVARSLRARRQLRDRLKRFAYEGKGGKFLARLGKKTKDLLGLTVGGSNEQGFVEIYMDADDAELGIKKGDILKVNIENFEAADVLLTDEQLEKAGIKLAPSKVSSAKRAQDIADLLANKLEAPGDWSKSSNGDWGTEDGFTATALGDNKYALKDSDGNPVEGLDAAEWPEIQRHIMKVAEDEFGDGLPDTTERPEGEQVKPATLKKGDVVTNPKSNEVRIVKDISKGDYGTSVVYDDGDSTLFDADKPDATITKLPEGTPVSVSKNATKQKNADDYAAEQQKIKDLQESNTAKTNARIEESTSNYAIPNVSGFENGHDVFTGNDGGRWVWSDNLPMGGSGWVHEGKDGVVTAQVRDAKASGSQGHYSVTMLDGKGKFDAKAQYEVGGYEAGQIIYSINEAVSGANAVLDGKRADSAKISAPAAEPAAEPAETPETEPAKPLSTKAFKRDRTINTNIKDKSFPGQGLTITGRADGGRKVEQGQLGVIGQIVPVGDGSFEAFAFEHPAQNKTEGIGNYDAHGARFTGPTAEKDAQEWLSKALNDRFRPASSSDQPILNILAEEFSYKQAPIDQATMPAPSELVDSPLPYGSTGKPKEGQAKTGPTNPPTKKQKEMIRSMLRERAMSSEQRQEYMDRLAASEKFEISDLFNELKALPKAKVAFTDLTDPLNFHENDNLAMIKQQIAPFDLDGSIRRFIDEKTANGGEITGAEIGEKLNELPDWKNAAPGVKTDYSDDKQLALTYLNQQQGAAQAQANEEAKAEAKAKKKALKDKLASLKDGQGGLPQLSAEEHQAKLEELVSLISDENDPNSEVRSAILSGELRTGEEIVSALRKQKIKNEYNNMVPTKFSTAYDYVSSDESKNPEEWAIINAAHSLPAAPEGFDSKFLANKLQGYDNENKELAALIDSGASGAQVLAWLDENSDLWKARKSDYDTRMYVDLPWPSQKATWKSFGELLGKIEAFNGKDQEPGTPANTTFVDSVAEKLPQGFINEMDSELGNAFNGDSLTQLLGKVNNDEDLQRAVDEIATLRVTKTDLTEEQDVRLEMALDATIKAFYQNKKDLKNVIDEPANIVVPVEPDDSLSDDSRAEAIERASEYLDVMTSSVEELQSVNDELVKGGAKKVNAIDTLQNRIADAIGAHNDGDIGSALFHLAIADEQLDSVNKSIQARVSENDLDSSVGMTAVRAISELLDSIADYRGALSEPEPSTITDGEAAFNFGKTDSYEIGERVEVNYDPFDTGIGLIRSGVVVDRNEATGDYLVDVDNVPSNGVSAGTQIGSLKKDMRPVPLPPVVDDSQPTDDELLENPFSNANSDKLLAETGVTRAEVEGADVSIAGILDNANTGYEPMLKGITGNENVVKNLLDSLDESDGANNIAIAGDLYALHDALLPQGAPVSTLEYLKKLADSLDEFIPADDSEKSNSVTVDTIKQEQGAPFDLSKWKKVGGQKGSNPGGTYENPETGEQVYVKTPKSQLHAENERLAAAIYEAAGVPTAKVLPGKDAAGNDVTYSPIIDGATPDLKKKLSDKEYMARLQQGFAIDALLGNWDVIGLDYDNVVTDANGEPVRVDPGGALLFRAQGTPKGDAFGEDVPELDSFTDETSTRPSAKVFSQMTALQKIESVKLLKKLSTSQIDELVNSIVTDPAKRDELKTKLKARREFILKKFNMTESLGNDTFRESIASAMDIMLPEGFTTTSSKGVLDSGSILVKNAQDETVLMLTSDPNNLGGFVVQNYGTAELTSHTSLPDAVNSAVNAVEQTFGQSVQNNSAPTPQPAKLPEVTIAGPKLSDGSTGAIGSKVEHTGTGEQGTIVAFDKNPSYVIVKGADGSKKTKSINKLKTVGGGGTPAPAADAPSTPQAPGTFTPTNVDENQTQFLDSNGNITKVSVVKAFTGKWDVVYDMGGPDFEPLHVDVASREEAEAKALIVLGTSDDDESDGVDEDEGPAAPGTPSVKKFTFDFMGLKDVEDAPEVKDSGDPLDGENEKIKADSAGTLIKPGAIVRDENGRIGVYRSLGYGDPNKIRMVWEDGAKDSVLPNTVTATGKYLSPGFAGVYSDLAALDFTKNSIPFPAGSPTGGSTTLDRTGKIISYNQLVVDKNGDLGVVVDPSSADGYIKVAYPDGTKKRKADTLDTLELRYKQSEFTLTNAQKSYKTLAANPTYADKYNLPAFGVTITKKPAEYGKISIPKNAAGAKAKDPQTLGWNESGFAGTPSLEELLAMVNDTNTPGAGLRGGSIALDADAVEDLDLRIMAATGTNGEEAYLLKYKLTSWAGDAFANHLVEMVKAGDPRVTVVQGLKVPENRIEGDKLSFTPSMDSNAFKYQSGAGQTFIITQDDGTKIHFMRADTPTTHTTGPIKLTGEYSPKAYHNKVMIIAPKENATPESLALALQTGGVDDVRPSTEADAAILIENRLMSIFDGKVDPKSNASGKERAESLERIKNEWGIGPENVSIQTGAAGRIEMRLDEESAKKIVKKTKVKAMHHNLTGGSYQKGAKIGETQEERRDRYAEYFASRVATPQGGLLSTTSRWSEGIGGGGMSSQTDVNTGGADYVFTTPMSGPSGGTSSEIPSIFFSAERLFRRLDFWANENDKFGKRIGKSPIDQARPGGYEVMFKGRISFDDAEVLMVTDQDMRTRVITKLRQKGVTELGGRPLEAVVMTGQDYQDAQAAKAAQSTGTTT